jgi:hypothetical protein
MNRLNGISLEVPHTKIAQVSVGTKNVMAIQMIHAPLSTSVASEPTARLLHLGVHMRSLCTPAAEDRDPNQDRHASVIPCCELVKSIFMIMYVFCMQCMVIVMSNAMQANVAIWFAKKTVQV